MEKVKTPGIVLYNRKFRESDKLVKILTRTHGKCMFFVRHAANSKMTAMIQPLAHGDFRLSLREEGLSYIDDGDSIKTFTSIQSDLFAMSYATYLLALVDAAFSDRVRDPILFDQLLTLLEAMDEGKDPQLLAHILEIQMLPLFGVSFDFSSCVVCGEIQGPFDLSIAYDGILCSSHYHLDNKRLYLDPNICYLLNLFQQVSLDQIGHLTLSDSLKRSLKQTVDYLYDHYVGLRLKPKQFIDKLDDWASDSPLTSKL